MKGKHQEAKRKCRKKEIEDLDFEKTVKDCLGKYEKNQESLVFQKPREESRRSDWSTVSCAGGYKTLFA